MKEIYLKNWAAWGPEHENKSDWITWSKHPHPLPTEGKPQLSFIPALQRRRFSNLSRMALQVSFDCCSEEERKQACSVFASHHGEMETTATLLQSLVDKEVFSPQKFSHSVHNTSSGHFSIAAQNKEPTVSISGGTASFCYGFLEAMTLLHRYPNRSVLLVVVDEPLPSPFKKFDIVTSAPYGFGLFLGNDSGGQKIKFRYRADTINIEKSEFSFPQALLFLRWLLSQESLFVLQHLNQQWIWEK